jgi:multicomponent Na+:H+ antiporter subunit D
MTGIDAHLPALQVVVPMLTAAFAVLLQHRGLAWMASLAASGLSFAIAIFLTSSVLGGNTLTYAMGSWPAPYGILLEIDSFSAILLLVITGASTLALAGGRDSIDSEILTEKQPYFYSAWLLALAGFCGIVVAGDAFNIFVFMEISSLASYILIAGGSNKRVLPAVFKYLIMGTIGATFYLIGVGLIYMMTGTLNLHDMELRISEVADKKPILAAAGFITIGLALKAAVFPLHVWLPNAYTWAPHMVTAFLAACATKVSLYVMLRFDFLVFQGNLHLHAIQSATFLVPLAAFAILIGSAVAMMEQNVKRLFAFSSVAQIGYIVLGASFASELGLTASIVHIFNHALAKGGVFLAIGAFALATISLQMKDIAGIAKRMPVTFVAFAISGLSLVGIPGTAGFISKWYLITAALEQGGIGIFMIVIILASSLMAVFYVFRVLENAAFGDALTIKENIKIPPILIAVIWIAAVANIVFGLMPELPVTLAREASVILLEYVQ